MGLGIDYSRLNQEQKEAVTADLGPQLVIAGAGTGKTSVLTLRIAYLITEKNIHPSRILGSWARDVYKRQDFRFYFY